MKDKDSARILWYHTSESNDPVLASGRDRAVDGSDPDLVTQVVELLDIAKVREVDLREERAGGGTVVGVGETCGKYT